MIQFVAVPVSLDAAAGEEDSPRSITGVAVPWDKPATVSTGERIQFSRGAFDVNAKPAKLLEGHDMSALRGVVSELVDDESGLMFTAKFAKTYASDQAIELIKAGAYDSVSVGAQPIKYKFNKDGVMVVSKANLIEISLVAQPAFADAVITEIAASAPEDDEPQPTDPDPEEDTMSEATEAAPVEASTVATSPIHAAARREFKLPGYGEYIAKFMAGGAEFAELNANIRAAAPDVTSTDLPGILPTPIVAPIYDNFRGMRPVIDAVGVRALPASGKVFIRPVVTQNTSMGSVSENTTITAGQFIVDDVQITKGIYGGYVEVSEFSIDVTSPEVLGALVDDMARVYANQVDDVAADALVSGTTNSNNFTSANIADPTEWITWVYTAASDILSGSNGHLPDTLFLAPNRWASLGQLEDGQGRPLFPQVGPMNAYGNLAPGQESGNAFGLRVVVDRNLASGTLLIGSTSAGGFECWEQQRGVLSITQPATLSRQIAFRGEFAAKMIDASKFIKAAFV